MILALLHIPALSIYRSYSNFGDDVQDHFLKTISLGNLGFSEPKCVSAGMAANKIILNCKIGEIATIESFVLLSEKEDHDQCMWNKTGECASVFSSDLKPTLDKCKGKETCKVENLKGFVTTNKGKCASDDA